LMLYILAHQHQEISSQRTYFDMPVQTPISQVIL